MENIDLSVKIALPHDIRIGQEVKTAFYEKFEEKYETRMLVGTIKDIRVEYSLLNATVETFIFVETKYNDKTLTGHRKPSEVIF
jgi:hypothetical protein